MLFFQRFEYTFSVMGHSWELLKRQKSLLLFPLLSGIACLIVLASFLIPLAATGKIDYLLSDGEQIKQGVSPYFAYATTFCFYVVNYFVIVFFNSALVGCAVRHMSGQETNVTDGLQIAAARLPQIFGWALLSATVGTVLHVIENTHEKAGQIIASILGTAWTMMTFLVVPALVVDGHGPVEAVKVSTKLLRKTWGDQLVSNFGFGLVFFALCIPAYILLGVAFFAHVSHAMSVAFVVLAVLYLIVAACIQSALHTIFQASLYLYTRDGQAPAGFPATVLAGAVARA